MKPLFGLIFMIGFFTASKYAQTIENADFVSPMNEEMVAIQKGNQWGFINTDGELVIDFRDDVVTTTAQNGTFPIFNDGRCLITKKRGHFVFWIYGLLCYI